MDGDNSGVIELGYLKLAMTALLDSTVQIAQDSPGKPAPDLSEFDAFLVSSLSWSELVKGLHASSDLVQYEARMALYGLAQRIRVRCAV